MFKTYLQQEWKKILTALVVALVVAAGFYVYLLKIGYPMTEARNYYNKGVQHYNVEDYYQARIYFEKSQQIWQTAEAEQYLADVTKKLLPD